MTRQVVLLCALALISSCGDDTTSSDGSNSGTSGSSGESATDGETEGGTGTGGTTDGGTRTSTDSASGSGGEMCPAIENEPLEGEVTLRVTNATDAPIYVAPWPHCFDFHPIRIEDGEADVQQIWLDNCQFACEDVIGNPAGCGCGQGCLDPIPIKIAPGGFYTETWDGGFWVNHVLPTACTDACDSECLQQVPPAAATYVARARAGTTCPVVEGIADPCGCEPNADGWCTINSAGEPLPKPLVDATADVELPTATSLEVVFQ